MQENNEEKTPIICIDCIKPSGYFQEDFVYVKVTEPVLCKKCGSTVLDKPDFTNPNYN